jgi:hypothetical protein
MLRNRNSQQECFVSIVLRTIEVRYLYRHGHPIALGLSDDDLYAVAPSLRLDKDKQVIVKVEQVGLVQGEVFDWTKRGGHSFTPKIHWNCPNCDQQWFTDFSITLPNPIFESSGCSCVPYWLVSWDEQQALMEIAK